MFFVINKEKLYAYVVSIVTVVMLFVMAGMLTPKGNIVETSANVQSQEAVENKTTEENNIIVHNE